MRLYLYNANFSSCDNMLYLCFYYNKKHIHKIFIIFLSNVHLQLRSCSHTNAIHMQMLFTYKCYSHANAVHMQMLFTCKCCSHANAVHIQFQLQVDVQLNRAVIRSHDICVDLCIDKLILQTLRCEEVVNTPSCILLPCLESVRPP